MNSKTVLAIDGGGTCGFFSHQILRKLVELDRFHVDLIVGVSVGAILGATLSTGILTDLDDETIKLYTLQLFGDESEKGPWFGPKYKGASKSAALQRMFGTMKFGDLPIPMAIVVDRVDKTPEVWRSWDPAVKHVSLVQILDATSAVPVLFPPVTINGEQYIDGGTVTSSPICVGHLVALELFPDVSISLISLGTEPRKPPTSHRFDNDDMGIVQLISLGLPIKILTQGSSLLNEISQNILCPRFLRIEGNVSARIDDTSIYEKCKEAAESVWMEMESSITGFLSRNVE
jgi:predicted acylesterase/phospholipase RssA